MRVRGWKRGLGDDGGAAAVEFALIGPLFVLLLAGVVVYGGWLWLAQSVQAVASEAARAAVAGLDHEERRLLAQSEVQEGLSHASRVLDADHLSTRIISDDQRVEVVLVYDASEHPILQLMNLVPGPSRRIERRAVVRVGGY